MSIYPVRVARTWSGEPVSLSEQVRLVLELVDDHLLVCVDAPFHGDPPPPGEPGSTPGLWDYEVVELFVVGPSDGGPRYLEIELSPHGHYLVLHLRGIRRVVASGDLLEYRVETGDGRWRGTARVPSEWLPSGALRWNAFAIHGVGESRRYLAAAPTGGVEPDFHRLERFLPWPPSST